MSPTHLLDGRPRKGRAAGGGRWEAGGEDDVRTPGRQREDNKIVKQLFNEKHFLHIALPAARLLRGCDGERKRKILAAAHADDDDGDDDVADAADAATSSHGRAPVRISKMLCQGHGMLLLAQLLALPLLQALPVSSPEIANKSAKSPNSVQHQHQLKSSSSAGAQDTHLNSLSAFASSYEAQAQVQPTAAAELGFKPSYKLPEMETNFTPMQSAGSLLADNPSIANMPSTPMLMQYLPAQTLQDGSGTVQYLQLIPTRPIIVPISPFLTAAAAAATAAAGGGNGALHPQPQSQPALTPNLGATPDYGGRGAGGVQLSALPANTGVTGLHYAAAGLQGYANAISPLAGYRSSYRINRETKDKHLPPTFSLNMNEYLPSGAGGHDAAAAGSASHPRTQLYIRARS